MASPTKCFLLYAISVLVWMTLVATVHSTTETTAHVVKFENLRRTPTQALIQYCTKNGFSKPLEANRFARITSDVVSLEWFPITTPVGWNSFPYRLPVATDTIVMILGDERGSRIRWHIVTAKPGTDKLYWTVCEKTQLTSIDEDDPEVVKKIPAALLTFASNPYRLSQMDVWLEE